MNSCANAQNDPNVILPSTEEMELPSGKEIYIPNDLKKMNLADSESQWSYHRMASTPNFVDRKSVV